MSPRQDGGHWSELVFLTIVVLSMAAFAWWLLIGVLNIWWEVAWLRS